MNDPIQILKADHREVEQILRKLADSNEGAEREALVDELGTKLNLHMDLEEQIVYPSLAEEVGEEDREEAEVEHELTRTGLATVVQLVREPGFGAAVEMLAAGIKHHVDEEESELLPDLKDELEPAEWAALGDAIAAAREAAGIPVAPRRPRRSSKRTAKRSSAKKSSGTTSTTKKRASSSSRS
jgi:DUF438 domain-containing protein